MKRIIALLFAFIMVIGTVGCNTTAPVSTSAPEEEAPTTEAENTPTIEGEFAVYGYSLSGLNSEEVPRALASIVEKYAINITLDGTEFQIVSGAMGMGLNPEFDIDNAFEKIMSGELCAHDIEKSLFVVGDDATIEEGMLSSYQTHLEQILADSKAAEEAKKAAEKAKKDKKNQNETPAAVQEDIPEPLTKEEQKKIRDIIEGLDNPTKAYAKYDKAKGYFIGMDGKAGKVTDYTKATNAVKIAILRLKDKVTAASEVIDSEGEKASANAKVMEAVKEANSYLNLKIEYEFKHPKAGIDDTVTLSKNKIAELIYVSKSDYSIQVDTDELTSYANSLASKHSKVSTTRETQGKKTTTTKTGWETDSNAIYQNILSCLTEKKDGKFTAEYKEIHSTKTETFEGQSYIHVNLDAQKVYLYLKGELVLTSSCVSGCVANNTRSDRGTFSVYSKDRDRYLTGPNYKSYVNFFMPYNGGEGLHDASWRDEFGGTIYLYSGSHGCINMPYSKAEQLFNQIWVGITVRVTGGATSIGGIEQVITAPSTLTMYEDDTYQIEASVLGGASIEYIAMNYEIADVSSTGLISAFYAGETQIKITALPTEQYSSATFYITVTVLSRTPVTPTWPTQPSTEPTQPSTEPTQPSTSPTQPSTEPTQPSTEPTQPSTEPSTSPSTEPSSEPSSSAEESSSAQESSSAEE